MKSLGTIIRTTTGLKVKEFCEKELNTPYKSFMARVKQGHLYPSEVFYLVWRTKHSITALFDKSFHELFILGPGGEITDRVNEIINNMSEEERQQLAPLMGIEGQPERPIQISPPDPENTTEEGFNDNSLRRLFINTYE